MEQRFYYSIASGSSGNCGLYMAGDTLILIDLGVSFRKLNQALAKIGLSVEQISALLITHEHTDHVKGLPMFLKRTTVPVYASAETAQELWSKDLVYQEAIQTFCDGDTFFIEHLAIRSFATPHDARGSVGYIIDNYGARFGFATDLGFVPGAVKELLRGCEAVVLESNHDPHMLDAGPYPYPLKRRVSGPRGHLSNPDCAVCAADLVENGTKVLILAHLSEQNNMPEIALQQTRMALKNLPICSVYVAPKESMPEPIILQEGEEMQCSLFG